MFNISVTRICRYEAIDLRLRKWVLSNEVILASNLFLNIFYTTAHIIGMSRTFSLCTFVCRYTQHIKLTATLIYWIHISGASTWGAPNLASKAAVDTCQLRNATIGDFQQSLLKFIVSRREAANPIEIKHTSSLRYIFFPPEG